MNVHNKIFVEGNTDKSFLIHYLSHLKIRFNPIYISPINGKDDIKLRNAIYSFNKDNAKNLIIIDADNDNLENRRKHIEELLNEEGINAEVFFFPNNQDSGNLEKLLKSIAHSEYASFFDCYDKLNECINTPYKLNQKDAIYAYQSTFLTKEESEQRVKFIGTTPKEAIGERFWNYKNSQIQPLKEFLLKHLSA
jgi:hypothetical protein